MYTFSQFSSFELSRNFTPPYLATPYTEFSRAWLIGTAFASSPRTWSARWERPHIRPLSRNLVFGHSKLQTSCGFSGRESSSGFVCAGQCRYPRHIISAESSVGFVSRNESMRSFRNYALGTLTPHRKLGFDRGLDQGVAGGDTDC